MNDIGSRIKHVLDMQSITIKDAAQEIGCTPQYLSLIVNGNKIPSGKLLSKIADVLDVNLNWLTTGEGKMEAEGGRYAAISKLAAEALMDAPDSFRSRFIVMLSKLTTQEWKYLAEKVKELTDQPEEPKKKEEGE